MTCMGQFVAFLLHKFPFRLYFCEFHKKRAAKSGLLVIFLEFHGRERL